VAMVVDETRGGRAAHTPSTHTHRKHVWQEGHRQRAELFTISWACYCGGGREGDSWQRTPPFLLLGGPKVCSWGPLVEIRPAIWVHNENSSQAHSLLPTRETESIIHLFFLKKHFPLSHN
jgi:hypothetical protein